MRRALCLLLGLAAAACTQGTVLPPQSAGCVVQRQAELPLATVGTFFLLPATIEGRPVRVILDTGSQVSTVSPGMARDLNLRPLPGRRTVQGVGGTIVSTRVRAERFALGDLRPEPHNLIVSRGDLLPGASPPVSGLAGTDVVRQQDLDFDVPAGRAGLYIVDHCPDFRPWPDAVPVPLERVAQSLWSAMVEVEGQPVRALLDTGARGTVITRQQAAALGVTDASLAQDPMDRSFGFNRTPVFQRRHHFASLRLGPVTWTDVTVHVADIALPVTEMLLGADLLRRQRVWFAPSRGVLFLH